MMKQAGDLRVSLNGYNKKDVEQQMASLTAQMETALAEKEATITTLQAQCAELKTANGALEQSLADYTRRKDALAQVELDAQIRVGQRMATVEQEIQAKLLAVQVQIQQEKQESEAQLAQAYSDHTARCDAYQTQVKSLMMGTMGKHQSMTQLLTQLQAIGQEMEASLDTWRSLVEQEPTPEPTEEEAPPAPQPVQEEAPPTTTTVAQMFQQIMEEEGK